MKPQVLVLGPGRVGRCLALAHQQHGARVQLLGRRPGEWQQWAVNQQIEAILDMSEAGAEIDLVLLAVADDQLQSVILNCAAHEFCSGAVVAHMSGAFGADVLEPLVAAVSATAALHPLMAFEESTEHSLTHLRSCLVSVDCADEQLATVSAAVACWQARFHRLPPKQNRASYHLALSLLSNHVTAMTSWAQEMLQPALGAETNNLIRAMSQQAVEATLNQGGAQALTGPVVRGDVRTVQAHLDALPADQAARYRGSLLAVIDLASSSGRLDPEKEAVLRALAKGAINS